MNTFMIQISSMVVHKEIKSILLIHKDEEEKINIIKIYFSILLRRKCAPECFPLPAEVPQNTNMILLFYS